MDNTQTLATLGTQEGDKQNTSQKTKKDEQHGPHQKFEMNPGAFEG